MNSLVRAIYVKKACLIVHEINFNRIRENQKLSETLILRLNRYIITNQIVYSFGTLCERTFFFCSEILDEF